MSNKKKVFINTYGCQMNEYDSEKMMLDLEKNHYEQTSEIQEADMVLLNTCNIRAVSYTHLTLPTSFLV